MRIASPPSHRPQDPREEVHERHDGEEPHRLPVDAPHRLTPLVVEWTERSTAPLPPENGRSGVGVR